LDYRPWTGDGSKNSGHWTTSREDGSKYSGFGLHAVDEMVVNIVDIGLQAVEMVVNIVDFGLEALDWRW
jgi:hypothetical protein